jgi:hypothetical protein
VEELGDGIIEQAGKDHNDDPLEGGKEFLGHAVFAAQENAKDQPQDDKDVEVVKADFAQERLAEHKHNEGDVAVSLPQRRVFSGKRKMGAPPAVKFF